MTVLLVLIACALAGWTLGWLTDPDHKDLTWTGKRRAKP